MKGFSSSRPFLLPLGWAVKPDFSEVFHLAALRMRRYRFGRTAISMVLVVVLVLVLDLAGFDYDYENDDEDDELRVLPKVYGYASYPRQASPQGGR
jgi:hypothetical protein